MKKLQVKAEVWFDIEVDEDVTEAQAIEWIRNCETLGDLLDSNEDEPEYTNPGITYYEIADNGENLYDSHICTKNSIWIDSYSEDGDPMKEGNFISK